MFASVKPRQQVELVNDEKNNSYQILRLKLLLLLLLVGENEAVR